MIKCKNIEVHMIEIFNFIMNSILVLCEKDRNPIIYFVGVIESSIKWFLRSVYKNHIVYEDSMSTEDVHGLDMNNLKSYSCNDTLGRLKGIALTKIYNKLEEDSISIFGTDKSSEDKAITDFQGRLEDVRFISPICECIVFPILSILTSIPYNHFKTIGPDHSVILSIFVQDLFNRTFRLNEYKELVSILHFYSTNVPAVLTTYKIKNVTRLLKRHNETKNFFGFGADKKLSPIVLTNEIISYFIGRISRVSFVDIYTGKKLIGIPLSKIETDMIDFYIKMFGGKMNKQFHKMRELIFSDFKSYSTI